MKTVRNFVPALILVLAMFLISTPAAPRRNDAILKLPKRMAEQVSADTGQPVIFQRPGQLVWGLSTKAGTYGDSIPVLLWLYNPTNKPQAVATCSDIDWFWFSIDVFDSSGKRLLSLSEQKSMQDPNVVVLFMCSRNFTFSIPPHTCMHGAFSILNRDFARDLRESYSLPTGQYVIVTSEKDAGGRPLATALPNLRNGLRVEVQ